MPARLPRYGDPVLVPEGEHVAIIAGWVTTEVGRQPFTVYGLMRTADSTSPVAAPAVGASLAAFVIVYATVFSTGIFYMLRLMGAPPSAADIGKADEAPSRAAGLMPGPALEPPAGQGRAP